MQRGVTLIELVTALVILGLLTAVAGPSVAGMRDRYVVTGMASGLANAHNRARIHAVLTGGVTELEVRADSLIVRSVTASTTAMIWAAPGPASQGIALTGAPRSLRFAPTGVTMGFSNATFGLTRGSGHRQVVVSRLGRVRVLP
jgi:prepilin-type N-terminal cleavage/methylation domain-containing protein